MRLILLTLVFVTGLMGPTTPAMSADHRIDPKHDIILGQGAPGTGNELIIYLSPGCRTCLKTYLDTFHAILKKYVAPGHLRVVLRQVPQLHTPHPDRAKARPALQASVSLGGLMQCMNDLSSSEGAAVSFYKLAVIFRDMRKIEGNPARTWPLLDEEGSKRLRELGQKYDLTQGHDTSTCFSSENSAAYIKQFQRNAEILMSVRSDGKLRAPSYFLNGELIPFSAQYFAPRVLEALSNAIPEAK